MPLSGIVATPRSSSTGMAKPVAEATWFATNVRRSFGDATSSGAWGAVARWLRRDPRAAIARS